MRRTITAMCCVLFCVGLAASAAEVGSVPDAMAETNIDRFQALRGFDPTLFWLYKTNQNCQASIVPVPNGETLTIDFDFLGPGGIEYLQFGTPYSLRRDDLYFGIRAKITSESGETLNCSFSPRLTDPSGETHQRLLDIRIGDWRIGKLSTNGHAWGGDGDNVMQLPAVMDSVTMDRLSDGWKMKGRLVVYEMGFFTIRQIEEMVRLSLDTPSAMTNIFAPTENKDETLEFHVLKQEKYADSDLKFLMTRQINGKMMPSETIVPADGVISYPKPHHLGYESVVFEPTMDTEGETVRGRPMKFGFAVIDADATRNTWCCVSTHMNLGALDRIAAAGVGMIRDDCTWNASEREAGKFQFPEIYDRYVDRAKELGLAPLLIINYGNPLYDDGDFPHTDASRAAYARYAAAVVEHFKGRCRYYEIWNEWTGACGMGPYQQNKHNTPENYLLLLEAASKAIRAVDPDAYIIGGGGDHFTWHFEAIQKMMELGAMKWCDAFSIHPYIYPDTPEKYDIRGKMQKIIDCMRSNGCENPKLWLTELGYPTYRGLRRGASVIQSQQELEQFSAEMLARTAILYKSMPEVEQFTWYDLENDGNNLEYNEHNFGLLHNGAFGWQPKPSWRAYAEISRLFEGATVTPNAEQTTDRRMVFDIVRPEKNRVIAVWTLDGNDEIALDHVVRVTGLFGETLPTETRTVSTAVTYFEVQ